MADHETCLHEADITWLKKLATEVFEKIDKLIEAIHGVTVSDALRQGKVDQNERDLDRAFGDIRTISDDLKILNEWRQRFEGGVKVMLAIPVLCTVITAAIAIYKLLEG
jgi:hypothetical protein